MRDNPKSNDMTGGTNMANSDKHDQADLDNHANQLNPDHDAYWQSRGHDERPEDLEKRSKDEK
jgi:hypothetical protein